MTTEKSQAEYLHVLAALKRDMHPIVVEDDKHDTNY